RLGRRPEHHAELEEELPWWRDPVGCQPVELLAADRYDDADTSRCSHDCDVLAAPIASHGLPRDPSRPGPALYENQPIAGVDPVQDLATPRTPRLPRLADGVGTAGGQHYSAISSSGCAIRAGCA